MHKIVLLTGKGKLEEFFFNALNQSFGIEKVIIEESTNNLKHLKRRIRKVGVVSVFGQYLFSACISPILAIFSIKRIRQIIRENALHAPPIPDDKKILVKSVNADSTIELIQLIKPDIVIVNSTRIIQKKLLRAGNSLFFNIHCGITPMYKGYSGGYWALVNGDKANCGSTIHILDEGIDTGPIIYQGMIPVTSKDNFATYDFLHLATEIELLEKAIKDAIAGNLRYIPVNGQTGRRYYGPTIWGYFYNRFFRKVK
jgi:folate-dependent phosphoribosylglycinamide formyltransferase PurN